MTDLASELQHVWGDLFARDAVEQMAERLTPDFVQRDHRPLHQHVGTREDWINALHGWADVGEARLRELEILGEAGDHHAYRLLFSGPDTLTGGPMELELFVLERLRDGRVCEADVFDDRDAAEEAFRRAGPQRRRAAP